MYFTQEDYKKIEEYLKQNAMKDSQFIKTNELKKDDYIPILQDDINKIIKADVFCTKITELPIELLEGLDDLQQEIDAIWAKIEECCGKMAKVTLTLVSETDELDYTGGSVTYRYETEGFTGNVSFKVEGGTEAEIMGITINEDTSTPNQPRGTVTVNIKDKTVSRVWQSRNFKLIATTESGASTSAFIKQSAYQRQVVGYTNVTASLSYLNIPASPVPASGLQTSPIFNGTATVIYDMGDPDTNWHFTLSDIPNNRRSFTIATSINGVTINEQTGVITVTSEADSYREIGTVFLVYDLGGEHTMTCKVYQEGVIIEEGPITATNLNYSPLTNNDSNNASYAQFTVSQQIKKQSAGGTQWVSTELSMDEFFTKCSSVTFAISGTGATITNRGVVTKNSKNNGNNDLEYTVTMTYTDPYDNNRQKSLQGTVKQPKDANPVYNVTFTYPQIDYDGTPSTPTIKVTKNGSTITNYNLNITGITINSVKEGTKNISTVGFSGNKDTKKITAPANKGNAKTIYATITGTIDGVNLEKNVTITQDTINNYIWCGHVNEVPNRIEDAQILKRYSANKVYNGSEQAIVDTTNVDRSQYVVAGHVIMIPSGSIYRLSSVKAILDVDIYSTGVSTSCTDNKGRSYYMWHNVKNRIYNATSKFIINK